ncbi:MAG: PilZ domain-containing protein [SAR324 cluster bacterium]|nr:PilZ domain-containing protein [SAR324 cluster bacterium]MCZ6730586.1 PilZ domain-containing protein [SAR324 cluster bacterium]
MANLRSFFRRHIPEDKKVRVLQKTGAEVVGHLLDINQKGFRLRTSMKFKPGDFFEGLIEFSEEEGLPQHIQVSAQAIWNDGGETGFSIKEIPIADEDTLDKLIDVVEGRA